MNYDKEPPLGAVVDAAEMFVRAEIRRLAKTTIDDLLSRPAMGYFGDIAPQHLWDEYCWDLQEGPFDDEDWRLEQQLKTAERIYKSQQKDRLRDRGRGFGIG